MVSECPVCHSKKIPPGYSCCWSCAFDRNVNDGNTVERITCSENGWSKVVEYVTLYDVIEKETRVYKAIEPQADCDAPFYSFLGNESSPGNTLTCLRLAWENVVVAPWTVSGSTVDPIIVLHFFRAKPREYKASEKVTLHNDKQYDAKDIMVGDILKDGNRVVRIERK